MGDAQIAVSPSSVSPNWLIEMQGAAARLRVLDLRKLPAFEASGAIIPGALWHDHEDVATWARQYSPDDVLIVYCVHGHEVSQNATRKMRVLGRNARYLAGGFDAYVEAGGACVRQSADGQHVAAVSPGGECR